MGLFGDLFDFNHDGKMDAFEKAAEFGAFMQVYRVRRSIESPDDQRCIVLNIEGKSPPALMVMQKTADRCIVPLIGDIFTAGHRIIQFLTSLNKNGAAIPGKTSRIRLIVCKSDIIHINI